MRTVQFKIVPARSSSSSSSRTRTWTWIRTIATWHACLPACLPSWLPACSRLFLLLSHSRYLSLSLLRFASWRSQTRLRGCYPYAVFFENRQPFCCPVRHWLWFNFWFWYWLLGLFVMPSYPLQTHETSWNPNRSSLQRHRKDGASHDDDDDDRDAVRMMMKLMIESGEAAHACTMMKLWAQKHLHSLCITFYFTVSLFPSLSLSSFFSFS